MKLVSKTTPKSSVINKVTNLDINQVSRITALFEWILNRFYRRGVYFMDEEGNFISEEETSFMDEEGVKRFLTGS